MKKTIAERVAAGATVLDAVRPDWRDAIYVRMLDVDSLYRCPLGQVFGRFGIGLDELADRGYPALRDGWATEHGFDGEVTDELNEAWRAEIARGRVAG